MLGVPVAHERSTQIELALGRPWGARPPLALPAVYGGCSLRFIPPASVVVSRLQPLAGVGVSDLTGFTAHPTRRSRHS